MAAALGLAASVIAVLQLTGATITACYSYGNGVKNASRDKKKIIDQLLGLQRVLEDVRELVEDREPDISVPCPGNEESRTSSRLPAMSKLITDADGLPRCRDELDGLKKKLETNSPMQALMWPFKEGEVKKTLDQLGQFQQRLSSTLNIDQTRLTLTIHSRVVDEQVYNWLSAPDHEAKHLNACNQRQESTGSWFVQGECFKDWKIRSNSFLLLRGIPGAGKTVLCSTVINEITRDCLSDSSLAITYFYFDFHNTEARPAIILRSLVKQLALQCGSIPDALTKLFDENAEGQRSPTPEALMSTVKSLVGGFQNVYIVLDALDECQERSELLALLRRIHDWGLDKVHLLATSRTDHDIEEVLNPLVSHQVSMDENQVDGDIRIHVSKSLEHDVKFQLCSAEEKKVIETTLMKGAHGMFRWVACQLDALRKCRSPAALQKTLKSLPKTLYQTYDKILSDIHEDDRQDALTLLKWLAFSVRPISLDEAVEVLATDPTAEDGPLFDRRRRLRHARDILTICSSLVITTAPAVMVRNTEVNTNEASSSKHNNNLDGGRVSPTEELRLAHFSVREYLISEHLRRGETVVSFYSFNKTMADTFIAQTCLAYLLQFDKQGGVDSTTTRAYPLSEYAATQWTRHAHSDTCGVSDSESDTLHKLIMALFQSKDAMYGNWLRLYNPDLSDDPRRPKTKCTPLYYSSLAGLERATRSLLDNGSDVNVQGGYFDNALQAASYGGHAIIVRLLLKHGADAAVQGGLFGGPLQAAASEGHFEVVRVLLENGADVNAEGAHGSALQAAVLGGHDDTVWLLLETGADVNTPAERYGSVLQAAAYHGNACIVRMLLEHGANVAAQGGIFGSALQAAFSECQYDIITLLLEHDPNISAPGLLGHALQVASSEGNEPTVRFLLQQGADVNTQGDEYRSPLMGAVYSGHEGTIRLLLDNGADVNADGGSALQAAACLGHDAIVRLLLDMGADVNARGGYFGNALRAAASSGHEGIAGLLLEKGARVNAYSAGNGNPLEAAASSGHEGIIRLLLQNGADVEVPGGHGGNALQAASRSGHESIVRILLNKGADMNAPGGKDGNALQLAVSLGHVDIVQLLLDKGADMNAPGSTKENVLQVAARCGQDGIVQLLLAKGTDLDGFYSSALWAAAYHAHDNIIQLLLESGAGVDAPEGKFGNALLAAASEGRESTIRLLLEKGADVNARDASCMSALQSAASNGHMGIVQLLLEEETIDVNFQGGVYGSALQQAASHGHDRIVRLLLESGGKVNAKGGGEYASALHGAASNGYESIVRPLLENGAEVNVQGGGEYASALHGAASNGYEGIVRLLLENGAEVNASRGKRDASVLQEAASNGHESIVRLLLANGANVDAEQGFKGTALLEAALKGHESIVRLLLEEGAKVDRNGGRYGGVLHAVARRGEVGIVRLLLQSAKVSAKVSADGGEYVARALRDAASDGDEGVVRLLLELGAAVNAKDRKTDSALQSAAREGHAGVVRLLLEKGAKVNAQGGQYGNALIAATYGGHEGIIRLLLEEGADVNADGIGALRVAASFQHDGIVRLLLKAGAKMNPKGGDKGRRRPLKVIVRLLRYSILTAAIRSRLS